jgi:hypothetical protein
MKALFRNPFFTLLRQSWYLTVVAAALAWGGGGVPAFERAIKIALLLGAAVGGVTLMALLYGGEKKL